METIVVSLGGSLIVPNQIDWKFLKKFRKLVLKHAQDKRFVIITGGGKTARNYINAAASVAGVTDEDKDWLGIHATRINAHLLRTIFKDRAYPRIIKNPKEQFLSHENIMIAAGHRPGSSTDYDAVLLAQSLKVRKMVNLTNVTYVYKKDPAKHKNQKPLKELSWGEFRKITGKKWVPGLNTPFDPAATGLAAKLKMELYMLNGRLIKNLDNFLQGKKFIGSIIS